jgi:hypothetical protein
VPAPRAPRHVGARSTPSRARALGIVTPGDQQSISVLRPGDIGFIPTGWAHYIRNVGTTDMIWVLVFNDPLTDIGLSTMFGGMPTGQVHADARRAAAGRHQADGDPADSVAAAARGRETPPSAPVRAAARPLVAAR